MLAFDCRITDQTCLTSRIRDCFDEQLRFFLFLLDWYST
jgi:hypothetical protein